MIQEMQESWKKGTQLVILVTGQRTPQEITKLGRRHLQMASPDASATADMPVQYLATPCEESCLQARPSSEQSHDDALVVTLDLHRMTKKKKPCKGQRDRYKKFLSRLA